MLCTQLPPSQAEVDDDTSEELPSSRQEAAEQQRPRDKRAGAASQAGRSAAQPDCMQPPDPEDLPSCTATADKLASREAEAGHGPALRQLSQHESLGTASMPAAVADMQGLAVYRMHENW